MKHDYNFYVREGRKLLHARECYQAVIAFYASQVCTIVHGGKQGKNLYCLSDYAKDLGINKRTLSGWSMTYRTVIQRLEMDLSKITEDDWKVASRVSAIIRDEKRQIQEASGMKRKKGRGWNITGFIPTDRVRDLFNAEKNGRSAQAAVNGWTDTTIFIKNKLRQADLSSVSEVSLRSLKMNLDEASSEITNYLMNNKGVALSDIAGEACLSN